MCFPTILLLMGCLSSVMRAEKVNGENITTAFAFNEFNSTATIHMVGSASLQSGALQLTNSSELLIGRAYYPNPVHMKQSDGTVVSFNTSFVFAIVPEPRTGVGSGGLCFVMTPNMSLHNAKAAQYLGLLNTTTDAHSYNHIFAIEFDTVLSVGLQDMDNNHVGIDLNTVKSYEAATAGIWNRGVFQSINLKSGLNIQAWIEYDAGSKQLEVRISPAGEPRPEIPLLSNKTLNLSGILETEMYVGFSSSTGITFPEDHYILAWSFATGESPPPALNILQLPSFYVRVPKFYKSPKFLALVVSFCVILALGVSVTLFYWLKRMGYIEFCEEWELQYWPHRFPYRELRLGTKNFREENLLGYGGFGRVYHCIVPGGDIAVKCITRDCDDDGIKEFVAEISSLGRLQHRNLVPLRGWCRKNKRLFIVYDYMPNGSLHMKLHYCPVGLAWAHRYRILKDVAAGVLYLHEQWEKRIVHRDIKPSNVLLDSELHGHLGDFGLARFYDHSQKPQTTHVVGTLGYIAPELIQSGKASPCTDVFSFGCLMLEVACGRKPVDSNGVVLVHRVWDLFARGNLVDAVDPRLGVEYDLGEVEIVLIVGLVCCHPEARERPTMRRVVQTLNREAALPAEVEIRSAFPSGCVDMDRLGLSSCNAVCGGI